MRSGFSMAAKGSKLSMDRNTRDRKIEHVAAELKGLDPQVKHSQ